MSFNINKNREGLGVTSMAIGINPTVDFAFKSILGSPLHPGVTIHFLNSVLESQPRIEQIEFLNPFLGKNYEADKFSIMDIMATDDRHRRLNIEMQSLSTAEMPQRLTYYMARTYVNQLTQGALYTTLQPSLCICVLGKPLFPIHRKLHLDFRMREKDLDLFLTDNLQIHLLQLTHLGLTCENIQHASPKEKWGLFLLYGGTMSYDELCRVFIGPEFVEAAGVLEMIQQTPEQYDLYASRLKFELDEASRLESTRLEALQQGRQEGEVIGRIVTLQDLLDMAEPTREELSRYTLPELTELAERLRLQLRTRGD